MIYKTERGHGFHRCLMLVSKDDGKLHVVSKYGNVYMVAPYRQVRSPVYTRALYSPIFKPEFVNPALQVDPNRD